MSDTEKQPTLREKIKQKSFLVSASCMSNIGLLAVAVEEAVGMQGSINTQSIELMGSSTDLGKSIDKAKERMSELNSGFLDALFKTIKSNPKEIAAVMIKAIASSKGSVREIYAPFIDVAGNIAGNMPVHMIEILGVAALSYVGAKIVRTMYDRAGVEVIEEQEKKDKAKKGVGVLAKLYSRKETSAKNNNSHSPEAGTHSDSRGSVRVSRQGMR